MFDKILLPLDGSEIAEICLPYGEDFARNFGSELTLYHVRESDDEVVEHIHQVYLDRLAESTKQKLMNAGAQGFKVFTKIQSGFPAESTCTLVDQNKIDLIIMASVSSSGLKIGKKLGSVADQLCRTLPAPILLIRPQRSCSDGNQKLITKILVPLDGSDLSKMALPVAKELALKLKVPIILFQMVSTIYPYVAGNYIDVTGSEQMNDSLRKLVGDEIFSIEKEFAENGLIVNVDISTGTDAANEIMLVCKELAVDLIVMATHGRSGLGKWVLGSVAEKVLRYGETPLLLINARAR